MLFQTPLSLSTSLKKKKKIVFPLPTLFPETLLLKALQLRQPPASTALLPLLVFFPTSIDTASYVQYCHPILYPCSTDIPINLICLAQHYLYLVSFHFDHCSYRFFGIVNCRPTSWMRFHSFPTKIPKSHRHFPSFVLVSLKYDPWMIPCSPILVLFAIRLKFH